MSTAEASNKEEARVGGVSEQVSLNGDHRLRPQGRPLVMPGDFSISLAAKGGADWLLFRPDGERQQSMRGFEDEYIDIVDFIMRITHRIWEEKQVGYIYDTYRHNARVMADSGLVNGREAVVAGTVQTINAFPDFRGYADDIIWAGDDEVGFYTSHRAYVTGHNTGHSQFGPPTGRKVEYWLIANCVSLENEIYEEWVLYNTGSLLKQLGFDLREMARVLGNQRGMDPLSDGRSGEPERLQGQGKPVRLPRPDLASFSVEAFIHYYYHTIWNWRLLGNVNEAYARGLRFHGPTDREYYGLGEYKSFILSIMSVFPDLAFHVDEIYWMGNDEEGYSTSARWSLVGTHRGHGIYGPPTGRRIYMWGITQHRIRDGKIQEEWMMFNEFDVMQQIYRDV
jgi:predicted ester cyclase